MSAIVDREQNRFPEDPDRFDVWKPKHHYNQKTHQMLPPQGPSSASPGPWVPETITNAWMEAHRDPIKLALLSQLPEYKNAVLIRDSYRQYCFGPFVPPPVDDSPNFSMLDQPNVLAGERWLESPLRTRSLYKLSRHAEELESYEDTEHEGSLYCLNDDGEVEDADDLEDHEERDFSKVDEDEDEGDETEVRKVESSLVTDETMDTVYRTWFKDNSHGNKQALFETMHIFFSQKASRIWAGDDMYKQGELDDFQMDLILRLMPILEKTRVRGRVILQPSHYLTRTWTNCRITALKNLTKENRKHPSVMTLRSEEGDSLDDEAPTLTDFAEAQRWRNGNNAEENAIDDQEAADEALLQQREGKLATLDPDLADVVGMRLAGLRQREIAQRTGISQQAVSKKLIKAKSTLQEVN